MSQEDDPLISIITVNWNGKKYLGDLFSSLASLNYPGDKLQIIMVDNNSIDGSIRFVEKKFPRVEIVLLKENMGYAGGNNEGLQRARGRYIALINNDCIADPDWLCEMLSIFRKSSNDAKIGAVGPKVVFYWPYIPLQMISGSRTTTRENRTGKDSRRLGVKISEAKVADPGHNGNSRPAKKGWIASEIKYTEGFYSPETDGKGRIFQWTQGDAVMAVPIFNSKRPTTLEFKASSKISPNSLKIVIGKEILDEIKIGKQPKKIKLKIPVRAYARRRDIINSCGIKINRSFYSRDRGYMSFDEGQYNRVEEIFALSGSSFMMDRKMLEDTGYFDRYFFTYYEDIDLFWRARLKGWKHFFTPNALVRHHHCGSGQEWSYDFTYYVLLNRLLMIYKCGWLSVFLRSQAAFVAAKAIHTIFYLGQLIRGRKIRRIDIGIRFKIFFRLFYLLPAFMAKRIKIRAGKKISDRQIMKWFRDFK
ncbi:MAG: glycosyltransferase family 2 protein [Actinomycetia bacterium]|nr:glycosyltransferase family 2 protein [Actinomycetes bacterium]